MVSNAIRMLICSEAEVDLYAFRRSREKGCMVRIIRGSRCSVRERCMAEWGAAMQLPYCFEETWPSLRQSLEELTWPANTTLVILVTMINRVLPRAPRELDKMLQTMVDFAKNRTRRPGAPSEIELILHAEPRYAQDARQLLAATSVRLTPVEH